MARSVVFELSKKFALRIIRLYVYLKDERKEYVMSKQIYRCGTSIGANIAESRFAQSDADYICKLSIALKEASETMYWLDLLHESDFISLKQYESLLNDVKTITGTLVNIINKIKTNNISNKSK
ncbi:MAG: four helix bundle protein [Prevotella sp.]|jgi:four helix bundle protein|nr:four helix bundle protein [Prevotella sp.]